MLDVVSSENREKTLRFVLTFHGQATDKLPTSYRQVTDTLPAFQHSAVCWPTVGRQTADRFFGELFFTITKSSVPVVPCRVHHHSYASQVAYLRLTNSNLAAQCSFNMGKSGLSPQKLVMIPRMELSCFPPDLTE